MVQDPNRQGLHTYGYDNNHSYPYSSRRVCLKYSVLPTIDHRSHISQCVLQVFYLSFGVYKKSIRVKQISLSLFASPLSPFSSHKLLKPKSIQQMIFFISFPDDCTPLLSMHASIGQGNLCFPRKSSFYSVHSISMIGVF